MTAKIFAVLAVLAGCATEGGNDVAGDLQGPFQLRTVRTMAAERPIAGLDVDGAGGLWIAYSIATGGFGANDDVRVVHLDANGAKTKELRFNDEHSDISGIAFDGSAVWLSHNGSNDYMRALDPETGAVVRTFATETGVVDLDVHDGELRMSVLWNQVIGLDGDTGGQRWRATGYLEGSEQRGIASMEDGRIWVASLGDRIYVLDPKGHIVGSGTHDLLDYDTWTIDVGLYLAWDGHHVIVAADGQISWLEPY
jgi:hypothetical protein